MSVASEVSMLDSSDSFMLLGIQQDVIFAQEADGQTLLYCA